MTLAPRKTAHSEAQILDVVKGYLLLGVFYMHALYGVSQSFGDPMLAPAASIQIKLLAPNVAVFFFLNGMQSTHIGKKSLLAILRQSLMLLVIAALSHVVAVLIDQGINGTYTQLRPFAKALVRPIVMGTGYANYVAWFFVVLAAARIFAYAFARSKVAFGALVVASAVLIYASQLLHLPFNVYEWRNWPIAVLFFLVGMRIRANIAIPHVVGLGALLLSFGAAWMNSPTLLSAGPCLTCSLPFVAQPMVGQYGFLPVYLVQEVAFITFLLWVSAVTTGHTAGRLATYFGRPSLQMLLLHGWVLVALYPAAARGLPEQESLFLFIAIISAIIIVHGFLYEILGGALDMFLAGCTRLSRMIVDAVVYVLGRMGVFRKAAV